MMRFIKLYYYNIIRNPLFRRAFYSFPFQLVLLDFKKNLGLLAFWLIFLGFITNKVASNYGVPFLFLQPEYFNHIGFLSFFIVGFSCGGFIMAYDISSFIKNADRFPFLASLRFPFMKYCLNNFVVPLIFIIIYCIQIFIFLQDEEIMSTAKILAMILSLLAGIATFFVFTFAYFYNTSKDIFKLFGVQHRAEISYKQGKSRITGEKNLRLVHESRDWYVESYLGTPTSVRLVRSVRHYKKEMLKEVILRNSHSAFLFQMFAIFSLIGLGLLGEIDVFKIPAGASIFLLFTIFMMIFSSVYRWFGGWSTLIFLLLFLAFNYSYRFDLLAIDRIYGLTYTDVKAEYSIEQFKKMDEDHITYKRDMARTLDILNKWKLKNTDPSNPNKKPKMVFVNCSGGGLRSTLWTYYTLQKLDSLTNSKLLRQTQLITGSSGGMVGAAYIRELYLMKQQNKIKSYYDKQYLDNMSKDILNPISFKIATSEWFFALQHFTLDGNKYPKDRAYALEKGINDNTDNVLKNKRLYDYYLPEANSVIPMMIFSPSILNDGRKLLVSPLGISYITQNIPTNKIDYKVLYDAIEYSRFFKRQGAANTMFTSAIRMSATFPYISPSAALPSNPEMEIIDAGYRDNFGLETTFRFIKAFDEWISENTSGVIIIQIRDKNKVSEIHPDAPRTLLNALARPVGSCYNNLFNVQDYNQNAQIQMADSWAKSSIKIINLQLKNETNDRISLNWHLTNKEKRKVFSSINMEENKDALDYIVRLLK
jgi:hypothetical protein